MEKGRLLRSAGFDTREAANGQEAIEIWQAWRPHLIWMDIRMPALDGHEATRAIRNEELRMMNKEKNSTESSIIHHCKIIALTASVFEERRTEALENGCDDFVYKPFNEQEIFEKMRKHLGIRYAYEEGERQKVKDEGQKEEVLTPEAMAALPAEWLETLEQGARQADFILLSSIIEQIRGQDAILAEELANLAEDFEYKKILALIQAKEAPVERK